MNTTGRIVRYTFSDVIRSKWILFYTLFYFLLAEALLRFGADETKALLSLVNVVLVLTPLISILFGCLYLYMSRAFMEMLLAQPVGRRSLYVGMFSGLAGPVAAAFVAGVSLPFVLRARVLETAQTSALAMLLVVGTVLTLVFVALAFVIALRTTDKARGLGIAVVVWLLLTMLYDAGVLALVAGFARYPVEKPVIAAMMFNPVDLARLMLLSSFDVSALMGYTGAVFERFFGGLGLVVAIATLVVWIVVPWSYGLRLLHRKDF